MNLEIYLKNRELLNKVESSAKARCTVCFQAQATCYCHLITPLSLNFKFVILIHPIEARRRVATGRMSHLCLKNSVLLRGHDFSKHKTLNEILSDPKNHPVILHPGQPSANLSTMSQDERKAICPEGKTLTIIVIDGTWATAKKMLKHSQNLKHIPKISFTPETPSNFRVRKQPHSQCYSTIEAIHQTIELLGSSFGFNTTSRKHDGLLDVFNAMVEMQLDFIKVSNERLGASRYRRSS